MSTLTIRLSNGLRAKLTDAARRAGKSVDAFVRDYLQATVQAGATQTAPSLYEKSRDLCGAVNGGPRDLAGNKRHLKGYGSWKR